jgi:hypothetical protein
MTKKTKTHQPTKAPASADSSESIKPTNTVPNTVHRHTVPLALDEQAGLMLLKHRRFKQTQLRFNRKPPMPILKHLIQRGWTWRHLEGVFTRQFGVKGEEASIAEARQLFDELCRSLRQSAEELAD